jgi:hypothetical protein
VTRPRPWDLLYRVAVVVTVVSLVVVCGASVLHGLAPGQPPLLPADMDPSDPTLAPLWVFALDRSGLTKDGFPTVSGLFLLLGGCGCLPFLALCAIVDLAVVRKRRARGGSAETPG